MHCRDAYQLHAYQLTRLTDRLKLADVTAAQSIRDCISLISELAAVSGVRRVFMVSSASTVGFLNELAKKKSLE